jgi:hypothetical protein
MSVSKSASISASKSVSKLVSKSASKSTSVSDLKSIPSQFQGLKVSRLRMFQSEIMHIFLCSLDSYLVTVYIGSWSGMRAHTSELTRWVEHLQPHESLRQAQLLDETNNELNFLLGMLVKF